MEKCFIKIFKQRRTNFMGFLMKKDYPWAGNTKNLIQQNILSN